MPTVVKKACPTKPALTQLKSLHSDQQSRLQTKHQQDLDLLDDIRNFLKQRATIEKEYGQSLLKLCASYMQKKDYAVSAFELQNTAGKNLTAVWKSVLETNETFARESLSLSDQLSSQASEPLKQFRGAKVALLKRSVDQLKALQSDLQAGVAELVKSAKSYQDVEHETHETRIKASELDEKLKKKSTGIFTSRATLEKTSQKLAAKRDAFELKSVTTRNEYLLALSACNAANARFWQTDLIELTQQLDSDVHARMRDSLLSSLKNELQLACSKQERFGRLLMDLSDVSQSYQLECFLEENSGLFMEQPSYTYEAVDGDPITYLLGNENDLVSDAKRIASRYVADLDAKQTLEKQLKQAQQSFRDAQGCLQAQQVQQAGSTSTTDEIGTQTSTSQPVQQTGELETRMDDLKRQLRHLELQLCRSEAKLNLFRSTSSAAIDVDDIVSKQQTELLTAKPALPSPPATPIQPAPPPHLRVSSKGSSNSNYTLPSASVSTDGHRELAPVASSLTQCNTWDDEPDPAPQQAVSSFSDEDPLVVAALYDFDGSSPDELSVRAGERFRSVQDPSFNEPGWLLVENARGQRGIVPEAYVQFTSAYALQQSAQSPSQCGYQWPTESQPVYSNLHDQPPDTVNVQNGNSSNSNNRTVPTSPPQFDQYRIVRALYEYEAQSDDELNLREGDYLLVDTPNDADDDGWWYGCLLRLADVALAAEGRARTACGVFPSLVVEAVDDSDLQQLSDLALTKDVLDSLTRRVAQLKASLAHGTNGSLR